MTSVYADESEVKVQCCEDQIFDNLKSYKFIYKWGLWYKDDDKFQLESPSIRTSNGRFNSVWKLFYCYNYEKSVYGTEDLIGFKVKHRDNCNGIIMYVECAIVYSTGLQSDHIIQEKLVNISDAQSHAYSKKITKPFTKNEVKSITIELTIQIKEKIEINPGYQRLSNDLEILLKDESRSDVTFIVGDTKFKAHQLMLVSRSSVFAQMFTCDMLEKKTNTAEVKDIQPDVFEALLHFLYTGKTPVVDVEKMAALLTAADKYALHDLKTICAEKILTNINIETAADILILADLVRAEDLKMKTIQFIFANKSQVVQTESYKEMIKTHVHLPEEMFRQAELK